MTKPSIRILHLYPDDMNVYGDEGNVLALKKRLEWHGYSPEIIRYNQAGSFPSSVDLVVGGGGQDSGQIKIHSDLQKIGPKLKKLAENGTPMLMICGMYQLFGNFLKTQDDKILKGIGILDISTYGGTERLSGNILTESDEFGQIVGYENHSGQSYLGKDTMPLGNVLKGAGNNGKDNTEGARYKNVIGTYLHGSLLPKNPLIADWLIEKAAMNKFGEFKPSVIDDSFALEARRVASRRPR